MNLKGIYQKDYIISPKKLDVKKLVRVILKGLKIILKNFIKKEFLGLDLKKSEDKIAEAFENYLRVKFLDFKNNSQIDKKLKSYKKDLNDRFKSKISELKDLSLRSRKI